MLTGKSLLAGHQRPPGLFRAWSIRALRRWVFFVALAALGALAANPSAIAQFPLTNISQVLRASSSDLARNPPVVLHAVITYADPGWSSYFIQDGTGGIFLNRTQQPPWIEPGTAIAVEGDALPSVFAPVVRERKTEILAFKGLPDAKIFTFEELAGGKQDSQWVEIEAIPRSASILEGHLRLKFNLPEEMQAFVPNFTGQLSSLKLVDALVRIRGVCGTRFNSRGQLLEYRLFVPNLQCVRVIDPPAADPFAMVSQPLAAALGYSHAAHFGHRIKASGVVTAQDSPTEFFFQDQSDAAHVQSRDPVVLSPGDRVEVVGFPVRFGAAAGLEEALVRKVGHEAAPEPIPIVPRPTPSDSWDARLVRVNAEVVHLLKDQDSWRMLMRAGDNLFDASVATNGVPDSLPDIEEGCRLAVTGTCSVALDDNQVGKSISLRLRSPADIQVLQRPSWWTGRRLIRLLGAALLLVLVWRLHGLWRETKNRRRSEAMLRDSEARFRRLADASFEAVGISDKGLVVDGNPQLAKLLGYDLSEIIGKPVIDLLAPEFREMVAAHMREKFEGSYEVKLLRKDGTKVIVECNARITRLEGRELRITALRELTERIEAQEQQARMSMAVEHSDESIMITDTTAQILYVNPAFERVTGYTRDEVVGRNSRILKSGQHDELFYRQLWENLSGGESWVGQFINKRKNGELFHEEAVISPVRDAGGKVINYVAVKRDITREREIEEQLRQSQKLESIGRLAGGVAHDFNNVLAAMMIEISLLQAKTTGDATTQEALTDLDKLASRAANLTRQLLMFSRRSPMQICSLDLNQCLADLHKMLRRLLGDDITVDFSNKSTLPPVAADRGMIEQVVVNLCVNARDAMPHGGKLVVRTAAVDISAEQAEGRPEAKPGQFVCLSVTDTGTGMSQAVLERVFEPFYTTKEIGKGTGLGLASVYGIVKQHGGWLEVESQEGRGSTFLVFLPVASDTVPTEKVSH
jgi:PAS domain S-box-containing protein